MCSVPESCLKSVNDGYTLCLGGEIVDRTLCLFAVRNPRFQVGKESGLCVDFVLLMVIGLNPFGSLPDYIGVGLSSFV